MVIDGIVIIGKEISSLTIKLRDANGYSRNNPRNSAHEH